MVLVVIISFIALTKPLRINYVCKSALMPFFCYVHHRIPPAVRVSCAQLNYMEDQEPKTAEEFHIKSQVC